MQNKAKGKILSKHQVLITVLWAVIQISWRQYRTRRGIVATASYNLRPPVPSFKIGGRQFQEKLQLQCMTKGLLAPSCHLCEASSLLSGLNL